MAKLTSQQKELMDSLGFKNQRIVAAVFFLIAILIVTINIGFRYRSNSKLEKYPHVEGVVTGDQVYTEHIGRRERLLRDSWQMRQLLSTRTVWRQLKSCGSS